MRKSCVSLALLAALLGTGAVHAQNYPNRVVRIITSDAGSGVDFTARVVAQGISEGLGQQVIVDNRGTFVAIEAAAKAAPDGYTFLVMGSALWLAPFIQKVNFDPPKDFVAVSSTDRSPNVLVTNPGFPAKTVKEIIALAKAQPGVYNYARAGVGGPTHLSAELFRLMGEVDIVAVPFKAGGPAVIGLMSNQSHMMFSSAAPVAGHIKSGKLRGIAVTTEKRSPIFPDLPSISEAGLPGYDTEALYGLLAPAGTPAAIINRVSQEVLKVLARQDAKEKFFGVGSIAGGSTPGDFGSAINAEVTKWGKVLRDAGVKPE